MSISTKDSNQSIEALTGYSFSLTPTSGVSEFTSNTLNIGNLSDLDSWINKVIFSHGISINLFPKIKVSGFTILGILYVFVYADSTCNSQPQSPCFQRDSKLVIFSSLIIPS